MEKEEYVEIGKLDKILFDKIGQILITDEVIFTYERRIHVETKRIKLFEEVKDVLADVVYAPDYIYTDWNNRDDTLILIKSLGETVKLNVVLKIALANDEKHTKNSIITMIKIGQKSFNKIQKNKRENLLYERIDKKE